MSDIAKLAASIRDGINKNIGKEIAKAVSNTEELLQVADWIEMPEYFTTAVGGKGYPCGHLTQIVGPSDSGKSTLIMEGMTSCQKAGGLVFLIDSEHKFSFERFEKMGGSAPDVITISVDSLEEAWDAIKEVTLQIDAIRKKHPDVPVLLAWDSVAASVSDAMLDADAEKKHVAVDAKINNIQVRRLRQSIKKNKIAAIFINHSYWTMPSFGISTEVLKGGSELYYMSTLILKTKRRSWLKRTVKGLEQKWGIQSLLEVMKGHLGGRKTRTEMYIAEKGIFNTKEEAEESSELVKGTF